ncbi:MAG: hypothetical protein RJB62_11 [Pseudomonadota bacterium]|jgi:hypothetical protein
MSVDGNWKVTVQTPMGPQDSTIAFKSEGNTLTGTQFAPNGGSADIQDGQVNGNQVSWNARITKPFPLTIEFNGTVDGDTMSGKVKFGMMGSGSFSGAKV